ncbi:hypothetical protein VNO78_19820 [Psophocarpus tetragonolobus]|uniref:Uncharacterized protein n=1 Tax=Psophocarpus tetragonolobus TaxID=3891 RepID=A0AAN9XGI9_PSOTE
MVEVSNAIMENGMPSIETSARNMKCLWDTCDFMSHAYGKNQLSKLCEEIEWLIVTSLESQEVAHGEHAIVSCDDEFKEAKDGLKSMEEIKTPINVMGKEMCKVEEVVGGELGLKGLVDIDIQYDVEEFRKE